MQALNASVNAKELREEAYADRYVTLKPVSEVQGFRVEGGAELHNDDGSITPVKAGDWVVEAPDGTLIGVPGKTIFENYEPKDSGNEDFAATKEACEHEPPEQDDTVRPFAGEQIVPSTVDDPEIQGVTEGERPENDPELDDGSPAARDRTKEEFASMVAEAERRLHDVVAQAVADRLVTSEQGAEWKSTGEPPKGVYVIDTPSGLRVTTEKSQVTEEDPGNENLKLEGQPEPDGPTYRDMQRIAGENKLPKGGSSEELRERLKDAGLV